MTSKFFNYIKGIMLFGIVALIPVACSQSGADEPDYPTPEPPEEPTISSDSVMVSLNLSSLEWEVSPMSRASNDDLYGLIVYQTQDSICDGKYPTTSQTATALFDNPSLISLKLAKNQYYHFSMIYIPDGKNLVASNGNGRWQEPFYIGWDEGAIPELNTVVYKKAYNTVGFVHHNTCPKGEARATLLNTIVRYHGVCTNFKPDNDNQKATIKLYRWQYGIRIKATDFHSGKVMFRVGDNTGAKLVMDSNSTGTSVMEYNVQFPIYNLESSMLQYGDAAAFADNHNFFDKMDIVYITSDGDEILLWTSGYNFPFKRMKMHSLEFSLNGALTNGGIEPDLMETEDTPMEETKWEL
ncbi:MAG: hypothetical protein K2H44_05050 [Muribaculaceae bacterium]|nr:hypothetical protein [Muribaculaceae bacterium]